MSVTPIKKINFNPRSPCGERRALRQRAWLQRHFNPRSPCGERRNSGDEVPLYYWISIHAPRVGSDNASRTLRKDKQYFNPRSPCGERRFSIFLSFTIALYFNPRSPCGERPTVGASLISKTTPFQSTLPVWGATSYGRERITINCISIHAPRVGSDESTYDFSQLTDISIHAPRVGSDFLEPDSIDIVNISIHAPRVGSDAGPGGPCCRGCHFNPRSPCGERHPLISSSGPSADISIHAPRVGSD